MAFTGLVAFIASLSLPMIGRGGVASGTFPCLFSVVLFCLSLIYFFIDNNASKIEWRCLVKKPTVDGLIFYLLTFGLYGLIYFIGTAFALLIFGIVTQLILKRQKLTRALLFNAFWVGFLYIVFEKMLYIPFESGFLFR
jgi:ammonia channel protein AmtB